MSTSDTTVEYLDWVDRELQKIRSEATQAKNMLIETVEKCNQLQLSLNQRRVALMQDKLSQAKLGD